jgi:hypothetical protein
MTRIPGQFYDAGMDARVFPCLRRITLERGSRNEGLKSHKLPSVGGVTDTQGANTVTK